MSETITVTTADCPPQKFEMATQVARQSNLLKDLMENGDGSEVPLTNVEGDIMKRIIEWMEHHKDDEEELDIEKPLRSEILQECGVSDYDANFVDVDNDTLFKIILAANFLDISQLLELTCAKLAALMKGKTAEEIRGQFGIPNDFTPEEEEQIKEENKWLEEI
jgi:S-phase kinase-associated protein 1